MQIAGCIPYWVLTDGPPHVSSLTGGPDHPGRRCVFMPGCFSDSIAIAESGRHPIRLLAEHDFGRELATTANASLRLADGPKALYWIADLAADPGVPVRACSLGSAHHRKRPHTFSSGEVIEAIERGCLMEISLVARPAFDPRKAWARADPPESSSPAPRISAMPAVPLFPIPNPFAPRTADVGDTLIRSLLAGGHLRRDDATGELVPTESGKRLAREYADAASVRPDVIAGAYPTC